MTDLPPGKDTPMLRQYRAVKNQAPGAILLFRLGDFYEMFGEDARRAAPVLEIALTARNTMPMCGIPYHAATGYIAKLVKAGFKVAVCDQVEDPRQARGIVRREITRIITPGTMVEEELLDQARANYLAAVCRVGSVFGLASLEISTGEFRTTEIGHVEKLLDELIGLRPGELLLPPSLEEEVGKPLQARAGSGPLSTTVEEWKFDYEMAYETLNRQFGTTSLDGFGCAAMIPGISAAGAVMEYARENLRRPVGHIHHLVAYETGNFMVLDAATRSSLELVEPLRGTDDSATLLGAVRRTVTPMGARLLREWLVRPLVDPAAIDRRLETVEGLVSRREILISVRDRLKEVRDLQRLIARIACGTPNPRDLGAVRQSLRAVPGFREELTGLEGGIWEDIRAGLHDFTSLVVLLEKGLVDTPPLSPGEGGVIREGFDGELDEVRRLAREGKDWISRYQAEEIDRTGIKSLKVRYNKVFGYFIEVTKANLPSVPDHYLRKQTLANAERFITEELKEYEDKVLGAQERAAAMEYALFEKLRDEVRERERLIQETASALALLDVVAGFADTALSHKYVRPIVEESGILTIRNGRHPVVEQTVAAGNFVGNDTEMDGEESQIHIITGPNMAGKSTYIRQVALIVLLAQTGSFVPADYARIGCADRIFARVGASDDLSRGQSTFMVEMTETANILHHATPRSLIILDEIGRGTSTFDGISIAWAVAEYLHNRPARKARTLFATHYHELTELELTLPGVKNFNVAVREWNDRVIFLRKVVPGGTDRSYGIQVARLAGLPRPVIERANRILAGLESGTLSADGKPKFAGPVPAPEAGGQQLTLFDAETADPVVDELRSMRLEFMTPFEAMQRLKELKDRLDRSGCRG